MLEFFDTHVHLSMLEENTAVETYVERAGQAGVATMVSVSTEQNNFRKNQEFANQFPNVYFSLGVHPHEAVNWIQWASDMHGFFPENKIPNKCVAIGEMGLDFHYDYSPREIQLDVLENQLNLARTLNLPVILHCRDAFDALFASIKKVGLSEKGGVMHCFTGGPKEAKTSVDLGLKISFSGILTFKNAEPLREAAKQLPLSEIVLETDCPYLAPIPHRGKPNEPSFLPFTAQVLAQTRGENLIEIASATTQNAKQLFGV